MSQLNRPPKANEFAGPTASHVSVTDATIDVELTDGRSLSVPVSWYPRLEHTTKVERDNWMLIGSGFGYVVLGATQE
jgi:hypothetical protein